MTNPARDEFKELSEEEAIMLSFAEESAEKNVKLVLKSDGIHGCLCGVEFPHPFGSQSRALMWLEAHKDAAVKLSFEATQAYCRFRGYR